MSDGAPLGYSMTDLVRLSGIGERALRLVGVEEGDVLVNLLPPSSVSYWQVVYGSRRVGTPAAHVGPTASVADIATLQPSVLVGGPRELRAVFSRGRAPDGVRLRIVVCIDRPERGRRGDLVAAVGRVAYIEGWLGRGARAAWFECAAAAGAAGRGEAPQRFHTWPDTEIIETDERGELLWTGVGWRGSAVLRARTGEAATVDPGPCPACGRPGPTIVPAPVSTPERVLGRAADILAWQVEQRPDGALVVWLAPVPGADITALTHRIDAELGALQYIVEDSAAINDAIAARHGEQVFAGV
jgi:hypothetical protein